MQEIISYYDELIHLATAKCGTKAEAEDLVSETMLAALAYLQSGKTIEHPKTWLTNTLYHKFNDQLRRKYRTPTIVCLDEGLDIPAEEGSASLDPEEAARLRRTLCHLAEFTREVMIRYYFGNQSVAEIAEGLHLPEGTVKSRLSAGRNQIRKGMCTMETKENHLPGQLYLSFGGSEGAHGEPRSLVENDRIAGNLLILAYEQPLSIPELSRAIGIPAAYIEPILEKLIEGELMVQTDSGKVYTDFLIRRPEDALAVFQPQLDFAHQHFDAVWAILTRMSRQIQTLDFVAQMGEEERIKLDRYAILKALQDFQHYGTGKIEPPQFPNRRDGGRWIAQATVMEAGYNPKEYRRALEYTIRGGHRTTDALLEEGRVRARLCEFDTTLWDSPHRFGGVYESYFRYIIPTLWGIHTNKPLAEMDFPNEWIAYIPSLVRLGMLSRSVDAFCTSIPILSRTEYDAVRSHIEQATKELSSAIGEAFLAQIASLKTPIPKHLTSVPTLFRYIDASDFFVMAIVREAYEKGLHLKGVHFCCPPVVLIYDCAP